MKRSLVLAVLLVSSAARAESKPTLVKSNGTIEVQAAHGRPFAPARAGDALRFGATVRCSGGCELALAGGARIDLEAGSAATLEPSTFVSPAKPGAASASASTVALVQGRLRAEASGRTPVLVRGPNLDAVVTNGSLEASASADRLAVGARSGSVRARTHGGAWWTLEVGQAAVARASGKPKVRPLLATPAWLSADRDPGPWPIGFSTDGQGASVGSPFQSIEGAHGYRVEVSRESESIARLDLGRDEQSFSTAHLAPGAYSATIVAIDEDGLTSVDGSKRPLHVVASDLPSGAALVDENRRAVLPETTSLKLDAVAGLEVAIGRRVGFTTIPSFLSIPPEMPAQTLWVREKGDDSTASPIVLERRALRASIDISPRLPSWPRDALVVKVKMEDPSGRADPSIVTPKFRVLLGITEIQASWVKEGSTWSAYIKPRSIHDVEVVRVLVADEHDAPLGRSFVEVLGPPDALARN